MKRLLLLPICLLFACQEVEQETPETRVMAFLSAFWSGNADGVWNSFDRPSQEAIAKIAKLDPDAEDTPQKAFLMTRFRTLTSIEPFEEVKDRPEDAKTATVELRGTTGESVTFDLVKEGDTWLIHLPPLEEPPPFNKVPEIPSSANAPTSLPDTSNPE